MTRFAPLTDRVWRVRKRQHHVDARLRESTEGVELEFYYNDTLSYTRCWPTRDLALEQAAEKRAELEQRGWTLHW